MREFALLLGMLLALTGCSAGLSKTQDGPNPPEASIEEVLPEAAEDAPSMIALPDGYPALISVSEIPEHMQQLFEMAGTGQAVAVAPGVWAEFPAGVTIEDAVNAGVFSGFCASKEAFERDYLAGKSTPGKCW